MMRQIAARQIVAPVLLLALGGCQATLSSYTVHVPPQLDEIRPLPSVVFVRATIPLDGLQTAIDAVMPPVIGVKSISGFDLRWHLMRQPTIVRAGNGRLLIEVAVLGDIEAEGRGLRCRAHDAGLVFTISARPNLSAKGGLKLGEPELRSKPRGNFDCGLPISLPIGDVIGWMSTPVLAGLAQALAQLEIPLGPVVNEALDALSQPRAIELPNHVPACLDVDPRELVVAPLAGRDGAAVIKIGVKASPRLSLGACVAHHIAARATVAEMLPLTETFRVMVALALPYDDLAARVAPALIGQSFGSGADRVTVESVELGDAGGRVLARVRVRGAIRGILYLWGTPAVTAEGILHVPDLQVSVETQSATQKIRLGLWQIVDGGLREYLQKKLRLDVRGKLEEARGWLARTINIGDVGHGLVLTSEITRVEAGRVSSQPGAVILHPTLIGEAHLQ